MNLHDDIERRHDEGLQGVISRRDALRRIGLLAAAAGAAGCTPLRIVLRAYPDAFDREGDRTDRVLGAFVRTVVPGAGGDDASLARAFHDPSYPFARHAAFFASDLCARATDIAGARSFDRLDDDRRARVVRDGLGADATTRRIYRGAIFLTQVATYAGIYDDGGSGLIDFPGANGGYLREEISYPGAAAFLPACRTEDGSHA
ncbi:MAG TPA: hypothetical protein VLT84_08065 [Acidobacteriota bacterium]|nr:hypothetical protein [Acidobacteriota bacterium]